jgi:hypothetical protein
MALFDDGMACPYCGNPMTAEQDLIGFTFVDSRDPFVAPIDDAVVHAGCLSSHPQRDQIVRAWNIEAMRQLGPAWMLAVAASGKVRRFNWLDCMLYRLGFRNNSD